MRSILAAIVASLLATSVAAQEFHAGVTLDYAKPHSGDEQTAFSLAAGIMFGDTAFNYGFEADLGIPVNGNANYDTRRLRLLGSYDFGAYTGLLGAGMTRYDFGDSGDDEGAHIALGVERDFSDRYALRGQFIRDFLEDSFTAAVTTTQIGVVYRF